MYTSARNRVDFRILLRIMAIFLICDREKRSIIASILKVSEKAIRLWMNHFLLYGPKGLKSKKPLGRKSKLTKTKKKKLAEILIDNLQKHWDVIDSCNKHLLGQFGQMLAKQNNPNLEAIGLKVEYPLKCCELMIDPE